MKSGAGDDPFGDEDGGDSGGEDRGGDKPHGITDDGATDDSADEQAENEVAGRGWPADDPSRTPDASEIPWVLRRGAVKDDRPNVTQFFLRDETDRGERRLKKRSRSCSTGTSTPSTSERRPTGSRCVTPRRSPRSSDHGGTTTLTSLDRDTPRFR